MKHIKIFTAIFFIFMLQSLIAIGQNTSAPPIITEDKVYKVVEQMPEFPNGEEAMYKWLSENIQYPDSAKAKGIKGKVYAQFIVNENGNISNVTIIRGIGHGCDEEVVRVVSAMPAWKPGKQSGKNVKVYYTIPVHFNLE